MPPRVREPAAKSEQTSTLILVALASGAFGAAITGVVTASLAKRQRDHDRLLRQEQIRREHYLEALPKIRDLQRRRHRASTGQTTAEILGELLKLSNEEWAVLDRIDLIAGEGVASKVRGLLGVIQVHRANLANRDTTDQFGDMMYESVMETIDQAYVDLKTAMKKDAGMA